MCFIVHSESKTTLSVSKTAPIISRGTFKIADFMTGAVFGSDIRSKFPTVIPERDTENTNSKRSRRTRRFYYYCRFPRYLGDGRKKTTLTFYRIPLRIVF